MMVEEMLLDALRILIKLNLYTLGFVALILALLLARASTCKC